MFLNTSKTGFGFTSRLPFGAEALFFDNGLPFFAGFFIAPIPEIARPFRAQDSQIGAGRQYPDRIIVEDIQMPTPLLCRQTMISRTRFCSEQASVIRLPRIMPDPRARGAYTNGWPG